MAEISSPVKLTSDTPRMHLLEVERIVGTAPTASRMEWDEHLHLFALLRQLRGAAPAVRGEVFGKLLARGFEHRYAATLTSQATAGVQPLSMLVRGAAVRSELKPLNPMQGKGGT